MAGKILVTCATGGLGQLTIRSLISQKFPATQIVALARDRTKSAAKLYEEQGVEVRAADFHDYNAMSVSMDQINTLMFISSGSFDQRIKQHENVINAAKKCNVGHIVYTSLLHCTEGSEFVPMDSHFATEEYLKESAIPYTIFRNTFYADLVPFIMGDALSTGKWKYPVGTAKVNLVAKPDVAEGLARVLLDTKSHVNKTYEITSWKTYNFTELAAIVTKAVGRKIVFQDMNLESFQQGLKNDGLSDQDIRYRYLSTSTRWELNFIEPDLQEILGRRPKSMEEYLPGLFARK